MTPSQYVCKTCGVPVRLFFYGWKHCTSQRLLRPHPAVPMLRVVA